jgi:hypothetical protein
MVRADDLALVIDDPERQQALALMIASGTPYNSYIVIQLYSIIGAV